MIEPLLTSNCKTAISPKLPAAWAFRSAEPGVTLLREESTQHPFALAVAAAWSCYGGRPAKVETVRKLVYGPEPEGLSPVKAADREDRERGL